MTLIAPTLQLFFTDRLAQQRQASPRTIAAYRDALKLLFAFVHHQSGKTPAQLDWDDLDATTISAFLNHLEDARHNSVRTRNLRLTAIRSLFAYAALRHPEHALLIQRVLASPPKRFDKRIVTFLTALEVDALIAAPDLSRWEGRRDRAMMLLAIQTGLRVSELTGLNCVDLILGVGANVCCEGKGRKQRAVPLTGPVEALLRAWLTERDGLPTDPLFRRCRVAGRAGACSFQSVSVLSPFPRRRRTAPTSCPSRRSWRPSLESNASLSRSRGPLARRGTRRARDPELGPLVQPRADPQVSR